MKLRILLADDNLYWRRSLASMLGAEFEVVATTGDGQSVVQLMPSLRPDVVVLDLEMPGLNGIEVTRELIKSEPRPGIVICSAHNLPEMVEAVRRAGASAFVFKHSCVRDLPKAIAAAASGNQFFQSSRESLAKAG